MRLVLQTLTALAATTTDSNLYGSMAETERKKMFGKDVLKGRLFFDADVSGTGTPNYSLALNYISPAGRVTAIGTIANITADGLDPVVFGTRWTTHADADSAGIIPFRNLQTVWTENSGTGTISGDLIFITEDS